MWTDHKVHLHSGASHHATEKYTGNSIEHTTRRIELASTWNSSCEAVNLQLPIGSILYRCGSQR
jgi:hypothetical protein